MRNHFTNVKLTLILSFCSLFSNLVHSQKKVVPGYYIAVNGDTIRGTFPAYGEWSRSPEKVSFVVSSSKQIELTPLNCLRFSVENFDEYVSYSGERLVNPIEFSHVLNNKGYLVSEDQTARATAFLRKVGEAGNCEVLVLNDNVRRNFFYKLGGQPFKELRFKVLYDQNTLNEIAEYRQQLNVLFYQEIRKRKLMQELEKLAYTDEGMSEFFQKLNQKERQKIKQKNDAAGWVVFAGASINNTKVIGGKTEVQTQINYKSSVSPVLSIGYIIPVSRNFNRYFVYPHVRFNSYKNSGETTNNTFRVVTTFQSNLIISGLINAGINVLNADQTKIFVSAGTGLIYLIGHKEKYELIGLTTNSTYTSGERRQFKMSHNVNVSTGITFRNKITGLATYNFPASVGNYISYTPVYSSVQIGLRYKLK